MGLFSSKKEEKEIESKDKLKCAIVIEIAGRPADYIKKAMKLVLEGLGKEEGVKITSKKIHKVKKVQTIFSTFAEVEMVVENLRKLIEITFGYMPSSIEIIDPPSFTFDLNEANGMLNDITTKLHRAEAVAKRFGMENEILRKQVEALKK